MMRARFSLLGLNVRRPAATLLITVFIVGAVAFVISMSVALRGIGELDMAIRETDSHKALALTDGCLQMSLFKLWSDASFAAEETTVTLGEGTCTVKVSDMPNDKSLHTVLVHATVGRMTHDVRAVISTTGNRLHITDWQLL